MSTVSNTKYLKTFLASTCLIAASSTQAEVLSNITTSDLVEPVGTYNTEAPTLINLFAKTVLEEGVCIVDDYDGCTFTEVLNDIDGSDDFKPEVKVHITGDGYPDDGLISNAKIRQRGGFSRLGPQKSFRIKLDKNIPLWRGERRIQLNKSFYDLSRIRNKLTYDLLVDVPNLPTMRTEFVKLTLENEGETKNLGLFTQLEYFGKEYLERRGWDKDSRVYKTEYFFFQESPDYALDAEGEPVDIDAFEKIIEIKRGDTHNELISFINDVNNPELNFQTDIFNKYLNQDNYLTWYALNILTDNADTVGKNHYYYNPIDTEKFYLVPWDYDLGWEASTQASDVSPEDRPRWWYSHAYAWPNKLHKRFLQTPGNLALLKSAVAEFKQKHLTQEKIAAKRDTYYDIVFPTISNSVDWDQIYIFGSDPEKVARFNQIFADLSSAVERNYNLFLASQNDPMPFYMYDPIIGSDNILFTWEESQSLTNQSIIYDFELSTTKEFTPGTILESVSNISQTQYQLPWTHPVGTYYFRVIARDSANPQQSWMSSLDSEIILSNEEAANGVREIIVNIDSDNNQEQNEVTNPVADANVVIDGNASDWTNLVAFADDADDIQNNNENVIDWQSVSIAHSDTSVYFLYKNRGPIDPNGLNYLPWGWQAFIDSDNNPSTGFQLSATVGADYIIEGGTLEKYNGSGGNWSWTNVGEVTSATANNILEFSFPRSWLGGSEKLNIVFQGSNEAFGGNTSDIYPDDALRSNSVLRHFIYALGETAVNQAPTVSGQNILMTENTVANINLIASDANNDPLTLTITEQPTNGALTFNPDSLAVSYTPNTNYVGSDSFTFIVNDGQIDSNTAIVSLEVVEETTNEEISNLITQGQITVNGDNTEWNGLTLFTVDDQNASVDPLNPIDWAQAGMAHSSDTIYLTYINNGAINPNEASGSTLAWGWQTFIDSDQNAATAYKLSEHIGAEYMIEGRRIYQYEGTGDDWIWVEIGVAEVKYSGNVSELSFPRNWLTQLSTVNLAFYGNNKAVGGNQKDTYPNDGMFIYNFSGQGTFGVQEEIAIVQSNTSSTMHEVDRTEVSVTDPITTSTETVADPSTASTETSSGGGSFSWMLLLWSLLLYRNKFKTK